MEHERLGQHEGSGEWCPVARAQWVHEMRNAVSAAGVSIVLAQRLLDRGDVEAARGMLARSEAAWARCRDLLGTAGEVTALPGPPAASLSEGPRAPTSPRAHR